MSVVRMAFFEGAFKPGGRDAFYEYARTRLTPLWTRFPGLQQFRMLVGPETDDGAPSLLLVLEFTYPSRAALLAGLASDVRARSREVTQGLFEYFDGRISHIVSDAVDLPTESTPALV